MSSVSALLFRLIACKMSKQCWSFIVFCEIQRHISTQKGRRISIVLSGNTGVRLQPYFHGSGESYKHHKGQATNPMLCGAKTLLITNSTHITPTVPLFEWKTHVYQTYDQTSLGWFLSRLRKSDDSRGGSQGPIDILLSSAFWCVSVAFPATV